MPQFQPRSLKAKILLSMGGGLAITLLPCIACLAAESRAEAFAAAQGMIASDAGRRPR